MLGQPVSMLIPDVVGFKLHGELPAGATATDLVLTVTEMLRKKKVVGKFVEFYGAGLSSLSLADRATIANMAPEYGATMGFFPVDDETLKYLRLSGARRISVQLVEAYSKEQGLFRTDATPDPVFTDTLELDLVDRGAEPRRTEASAGSRAAHASRRRCFARRSTAERERLAQRAEAGSGRSVGRDGGRQGGAMDAEGAAQVHDDHARGAVDQRRRRSPPARLGRHRGDHELHQHVESVGDARGGTARAERGEAGLKSKPWVKTSLAPGSKVVTDYFNRPACMADLDKLGFQPRRLRLHDLHRQLRSAARRRSPGDRRRPAHRGRRAVGQPQLRGTRQSADALQLPRVAAARRGVRAGGPDGHRPRARAARHRRRTARSSCATSGRRRRKSRTRSCAR